jgi:hypothetical protein
MGDMQSIQNETDIVDMRSDATYVSIAEFRARQNCRCRLVDY